MSTVFRVEKTGNFTVMSNIHLKDRRLSFRAKGLLAVILSLPPEWDYTITGLAHIAADGVDSVRAAVRELENCGYITRRQLRDERGRMSQNEYCVYENPEQNPDHFCEAPDNSDSCNNTKQNPEYSKSEQNANNIFLRESSAAEPSEEIPSTVKPTASTFNKLNKKELNTDKSIHSSSRASRGLAKEMKDFKKENNFFVSENYKREECLKTLRKNIEYDSFPEKEKVNEFVGIMADTICSTRGAVRVNGVELPTEQVKKRFFELRKAHIEHVLTALENNTGHVRNIRAYLITALYNAPSVICSVPVTIRSSMPNNPSSEKAAPTSNSSFDIEDVFAHIKARYKNCSESG